jgi:hypothetical protein
MVGAQPTYEDLMRHIGVVTGVKPLQAAANGGAFMPVLQGFPEAAGPGFEPGLSDSESLVLPLHHPARQRRIL